MQPVWISLYQNLARITVALSAKMCRSTRISTELNAKMYHIPIKPLTQNMAWKGRRYKSKEYKTYEESIKLYLCTMNLPKIIAAQPFFLYLEFGITKGQDCSNSIKLFEDILCKHLGVNDNCVMSIFARKIITKKTDCFIRFNIFDHEYDLIQAILKE